MARALIFFADGFEECEGLLVVDILRRAQVEVDIAAVGSEKTITSSHRVSVVCDMLADDVVPSDYDAVILPGGLPGSDNLEATNIVKETCKAIDASDGLVCAICAAPGVLAGFGLLEGEEATVYPGREGYLEAGGATPSGEQVTVVNNHITGQALGAAIPFALAIAARLTSQDVADDIRNAIVYRG